MAFPLIRPDIDNALLLYGCGFGGENDGRYVREAGIEDVTVVDIDQDLITAMAQNYPHGWKFVCSDALRYVSDTLRRAHLFDLVVADPYGGDNMDDLLDALPTLRLITKRQLIVGAYTNRRVPENMEIVPRSFDYCWWTEQA